MSAAPRNTIDIQGLTADRAPISPAANPNIARNNLTSILSQLESNDIPEITGVKTKSLTEESQTVGEQCEDLIKYGDQVHTYSSVTEDSKGQHDVDRQGLYEKALPQFLQQLYVSFDIQKSTDLDTRRVKGNNLEWDDYVWISLPATAISDLLKKAKGADVSKENLASTYPAIKSLLKRFLQENIWWLESKSPGEIHTIKENLKNVLAVLDSLTTIIKRSPLSYPNRDILNQEPHVPAYATKEKPAQWPIIENSPKPKPKTNWQEVNEMFESKVNSPLSFKKFETDESGHEEDIWDLHSTLVGRYYADLCKTLSVDTSPVIQAKLANLTSGPIGRNENIKEIDSIIGLLHTQIQEVQVSLEESNNLFDTKVALRSMIEQLEALKILSNRNIPSTSVGSQSIIEESETPKDLSLSRLPGLKAMFTRAKTFGAKIYRSLQNWWSPKDKEEKKTQTTIARRMPSLRAMGLIAGFASITSFFSGETKHKPESQPARAPIAVMPNQPAEQAPTISNQAPVAQRVEDITEPSSPETNLAQASIQRRLQTTLRGPQALQMFKRLYGEQLSPTEAQQTYIANTLAHILRPHLKLHSSSTTTPLHISYLGTAPHHRQVFTVWSGQHSETVRVHIPSWENLSQGMRDAGMPHVHTTPSTSPAPVFTGPSGLDSEIANNSVPPLPPGVTSLQASSPNVMAALDALHLADQSPTVAVPRVEQTTPAPNAIDLALDELAQADRTPLLPKRNAADIALEELAQADAKNDRRA